MVGTLAAPDTGKSRRRKSRVHERSRVALLDVFRSAFEAGDARKASVTERGASQSRSHARRVGVDESTLRAHVHVHLQTLLNTIRLDAVEPLTDFPHVERSIVNYGFQDLSNLSRKDLSSREIQKSFKQSLQDHEPRLVDNSLDVEITSIEGDVGQRVALHITADLIADPADIPVDYVADIDSGSGKVILDGPDRNPT